MLNFKRLMLNFKVFAASTHIKLLYPLQPPNRPLNPTIF
jgi:hypothetical protein